MGEPKGLIVSYILLVIGGIFGLHLVYLRRQKQAFIYATTLGWCGLGLIHDLFAIPRYVREANSVSPSTETPPFRFGLFLVQLAYGALLGGLMSCVVPQGMEERGVSVQALKGITGALTGLGAAIGCWLVGSIGRESRAFWSNAVAVSLLGAFLAVGSEKSADTDTAVYVLSFCAAVLSARTRSYDSGFPYERSGLVALGLHLLVLLGFFAVLILATYNYGTLETTPNEDEPDVKVRVEFRFMLKELPWDEIFNLFATLDAERFAEFWASSKEQAMLEQSYELLELTEDVTLRELKKRFRTLSAKHHPDIFRGEDRAANEEYYFKVVQAFETIEAVQSRK